MLHKNNQSFSSFATLMLYLFVFIHVFLWTSAPSLVRFTLPMDSMEGATWGHVLSWGYDKNPFLNAWLTRFAIELGHYATWPIYLFSQLAVAICFLAVWQLGKKLLPPIYALIAVMLLEGMQYYHLHAIDLSDNTLELPLWALTILFFYQAIHQNKIRDWVLTGLFAGLSMMTKYFSVMLIIPMLALLLSTAETRSLFKTLPLYFGLFVFLCILMPHSIWLFSHDFITVQYALHRVGNPPAWSNHIINPSGFLWDQLQSMMPLLILLLPLTLAKKSVFFKQTLSLSQLDHRFLWFMGVGPFLLTLLLSVITGIKLREGWGQPLFSLSGILLLVWLRPLISIKQCYRFIATTFVLLSAAVTGYSILLIKAKEPSSANFPGKIIAQIVTEKWQEQFHRPLSYVIGARWLAGNVSFYSKDHPMVYMEANPNSSAWINEQDIKQIGGIFIWDPEKTPQFYSEMKSRFSHLGEPQTLYFSWLRNKTMEPIALGIAFLPPDSLAATHHHIID